MGKTNVVCVVKNIAILKRRPLCVQNKLCKSKETTRTQKQKKSLQHYMSILESGEATCTLKTRFEKKMKRNEKMGKPKKGCRACLMI